MRGRVDCEIKKHKLLEYLVVVYSTLQVGERRIERYRSEALWERANVGCIVVFFNVLSGTCNRYRVKNLKEIKVEHLKKIFGCSILRLLLAPSIECSLCLTEDLFNGILCIELSVDERGIALIGKRKLVFKIVEAVVNRSCREHQNLSLHALTDNLIEQSEVTVFFLVFNVGFSSVAEVVRFINNHQVVVAPIQAVKIKTV